MAGTLVKTVSLDIGVKGAEESKAKLDQINARAEELKKAFPEYKLKIDSAAASERLAVFRGQVKATAAEASKPVDTVILTDKAKKKLLEVEAKAEKLKRDFPEITLEINDAAAKRKLAIFAAEAKVTADAVSAELDGTGGGGRGGILGRLGGLFSGGGGGAGGGAGGAGGAAGSAASGGGSLLTSPGGIAGIGGIAALASSLVPAVAGLGIGGAAGLGGLGLTALIATQEAKTIKLDQAQVKAAKSAAQLGAANKQLAADMKAASPFIAITADIKGLLTPLEGILTPFAKALDPIIKGFGAGLAKLAPQMTAMFQASLPFIQMFATLMLKMGATLMPAFTQAMNTMVRSGALKIMTQGLVILIQGLAKFVVALGPGMRSSAVIFKGLMTVISVALHGLGIAFSVIANAVEDWAHRAKLQIVKLAAQWDDFRHRTAVVFDGVRHDIAHIWDTIWNNTIGRLQRGIADDQRLMNSLRHDIASTFDTIRHNIASAWDTIWNNTVGRVQRGVGDVTGWFGRLPGRVLGALTGLGHSLSAFASRAMGEMWNGFKGVFSAVEHWFSGLPKMILHALGIHSPPDWAVSAGRDIMKGLHIGLGHGLGQLTSFTTDIGAQVAAGLSGGLGGVTPASGSALTAQRYAASLLSMYGWSANQMGSLIPLWNQESGWNANAVNPSSGAYGIPQSLGHGHPYNLGDYKNQVIWGLNYIRQRYGSPAGAWAHEQAFNWYGGGLSGGIFNRPTLIGVGERGPERVDVTPVGSGAGSGGSTYYTINVAPTPLARPADIGREVVAAIREHERRAGKSWRT